MKCSYPLQSSPIFGGINDQQFRTVEQLLHQQSYSAGSYLFHQGDMADRLFLITRGEVEVLEQSGDNPPVRLAVRGPGDSIGEMCLIDIQNRSASVKALEPVEVLYLSHNDLCDLYERDIQLYVLIIMNIAREISRRLRSMDTLLSNALVQKNSD
ncbi:MAG: cyclic nucleotide-binding domain-containing protein [Motiliproteus sp.]|nr:cyclic nucleotide-binding domain-containing protein [Motiliproteus sp.]MCW9053972.1 cyclic nucleotide-binding domain-containing protein [Motiliproteus sp.]